MRQAISDMNLWKSFIEGDDKAFETLFELYSDIMFRYGTKFIRNEDAVKDCIQSVFIKVFDNRKKLPLTDSPKLYLLRALKNKIIDEIRNNSKTEQTTPEKIIFYADMHYVGDDTGDDNIKERVEKILSSLTERQKEAIYLKYQMGLEYEDISKIMNINYQSTRNLVHRAIEKVRAEMKISIFLLIFLQYFY